MERSHEELSSLVAPYVLGAIPEDEIPEIRSHIITCDECMAAAEQYAEAASSLTYLIGEEDLPSGFEDRVIAQIRPADEPTRARRSSLLQRVMAAGMALLVVAVAVLGVGWLDARKDLGDAQTLTAAIFNAVPGIELSGAAADQAKLITSEDGAILIAQGLEPAPEGKTYQLWYLNDGGPESAGTFDSSSGVAVLRVPQSFEGQDAAAVTIEPIGGSVAPTTDPILATA